MPRPLPSSSAMVRIAASVKRRPATPGAKPLPPATALTLAEKKLLLKRLGLPPVPGSNYLTLTPTMPVVVNRGALVFIGLDTVECWRGLGQTRRPGWRPIARRRQYLAAFGGGPQVPRRRHALGDGCPARSKPRPHHGASRQSANPSGAGGGRPALGGRAGCRHGRLVPVPGLWLERVALLLVRGHQPVGDVEREDP
jgi:hypothetical protein